MNTVAIMIVVGICLWVYIMDTGGKDKGGPTMSV